MKPPNIEKYYKKQMENNQLNLCEPIAPNKVGRIKIKQSRPVFEVEIPADLKQAYLKKKPASFLKNLKYEIITEINESQKLWEEFSPKESLFDLWDFRLAFLKSYNRQPYFILLKKGDKKIGLMPLWYEEEKKKYFWFGGWWHEDNKFFIKEPIFTPVLLSLCPKPVYLNGIAPSMLDYLIINEEFKKFQPEDPKYVLDLSQIKSFNDYLKGLKKSRRHNLKKDCKRIDKQNPEVITNNFNDLEHLIALSRQRFQAKQTNGYKDVCEEERGWEDPRYIETFRNLVANQSKEFDLRMLTVKINNQIAGVDLVAIHKDCYYALVCGYDVHNFPGIGNYLNSLDIKEATSMGLKKIDFLQNNYQWKDKWFQSTPLLGYEA